jgi:hypothetical protein
MHERIPVPKLTRVDRLNQFKHEWKIVQFQDSMLSQLLRVTKVFHPEHIWAFHWICMTILNWRYKRIYRMEVFGQENIPEQRAIFLLNHPRGLEVILPFMAAFKRIAGTFADEGDHLLADITELLGMVWDNEH